MSKKLRSVKVFLKRRGREGAGLFPPVFSSPFLAGALPPGRRNVPQIKMYGTKPAGGASPSPTDTKCLNSPGRRRAESSHPTGVHHPMPAAPRGSTSGGASEAGSTGGPLVTAAQWQRAGERPCVSGHPAPVSLRLASEPSSPRKRGPGGRRLRAPLGARRSRPPAIFSPLLDRSKRGSPPAGGEIPPEIKYAGR